MALRLKAIDNTIQFKDLNILGLEPSEFNAQKAGRRALPPIPTDVGTEDPSFMKWVHPYTKLMEDTFAAALRKRRRLAMAENDETEKEEEH